MCADRGVCVVAVFLCVAIAVGVFANSFAEASACERIDCEGIWPYHLQGVATDGTNVYWTYTTVLVKTDFAGRILATNAVEGLFVHMGDLCCKDGKVYVGMNCGKKHGVRVGDEVWMFDGRTLELEKIYPTPQTVWDNNGLVWCGNSFYVVTFAPYYSRYNYLFEFTEDFRFKACRLVDSGWTRSGVQTVCRVGGEIWLGHYGFAEGTPFDHPPGTVRLAVEDLVHGKTYKNGSWLPVPIIGRVENAYTAEGLLERDGVVYEAHSTRLSAQGERPQRWRGFLLRSPKLNALTDRR